MIKTDNIDDDFLWYYVNKKLTSRYYPLKTLSSLLFGVWDIYSLPPRLKANSYGYRYKKVLDNSTYFFVRECAILTVVPEQSIVNEDLHQWTNILFTKRELISIMLKYNEWLSEW